jgi:hypothetical protein
MLARAETALTNEKHLVACSLCMSIDHWSLAHHATVRPQTSFEHLATRRSSRHSSWSPSYSVTRIPTVKDTSKQAHVSCSIFVTVGSSVATEPAFLATHLLGRVRDMDEAARTPQPHQSGELDCLAKSGLSA